MKLSFVSFAFVVLSTADAAEKATEERRLQSDVLEAMINAGFGDIASLYGATTRRLGLTHRRKGYKFRSYLKNKVCPDVACINDLGMPDNPAVLGVRLDDPSITFKECAVYCNSLVPEPKKKCRGRRCYHGHGKKDEVFIQYFGPPPVFDSSICICTTSCAKIFDVSGEGFDFETLLYPAGQKCDELELTLPPPV